MAGAPGVTVLICTHNGSARLPVTLAHLAAQRVPSSLGEVLVIDNASTDDSAGAARKAWPAEARFELVSFVDDDNWVGPDWVETASLGRGADGAGSRLGGVAGRRLSGAARRPPWVEPELGRGPCCASGRGASSRP